MSPPPPPPAGHSSTASPPADLSGREEEVLRLLAWGFSNKVIAARLRLSVKTVETYKTRSLDKLKIRSRVDLVRHALRAGWLTADAEPPTAAGPDDTPLPGRLPDGGCGDPQVVV